MKKVLLLLFLIFITACQNNDEVIKSKFDVELMNLEVSSNSLNFSVLSSIENIKFKLLKDEQVIIENTIGEVNEINDLESNTDYVLVIYNDTGKKKFDIKTQKVTTLMFTGDILLGSYFGNYIDQYGVDYPWNDVKSILNRAEVSMVNLETSVSDRGKSTKSEGYGFRSLPYTLEGLVNSGIDIVSLANNHVIDYGYEAFTDTFNNLDNYNIKYVGAGKNKEEANKEQCFNVNDLRICYMASTSILGYSHWKAESDKSGVMYFNKENYEEILNKIKSVKATCDYLIYNVHWGVEYSNYPTESQKELAHMLVDAGVDILVGHHPHVLQGVEYYKNSLIMYSLGNFIFLIKNDNASRSGIFEISLDNKEILSSKIYPIEINACKANLLNKDDSEYKIIIDSLNERSNKFGSVIDMYGNIEKIN